MSYNLSEISLLCSENINDNDSAMPIIGLYVAAASLACSFAMFLNSCLTFINLFPKFNARFSSNFFALNATWLTLLAVATKLAGDLSTPKWSLGDTNAKNTSTVFLTVAIGNFFTSLGSMSNTDILTNVTALSILVITILVDLCIQIRTHVFDFSSCFSIIFKIDLLFCTWISIVCSALAVPAIKKRAESKYQKLAASDHEKHMEAGQQGHTIEELRLSITKYWVMAASGCPRSLMKRLVTFGFTSMMCVLSSLTLILGLGFGYPYGYWYCERESGYKWSIDFIFFSQFYALYPSALIITVFLIGVLGYKYEDNGIKIRREEFTTESYWTEKLVEWRQTSMSMRWFKRRAVRKLIHNIKGLVFTFCIRLQIMIVIWCKFCYILSFYSMLPLVFLVNFLGKLINHFLGKLFHKNKVSTGQRERQVDLNCFLILLEGEKQFPERLLREIISRVDKHVEMGKMQRPQNLFNLLNQSFSFSGVIEFDSNRVPSLLSSEPPNCWTLPVVTLTSIAIAIPNIASQHVDWLVRSVNEGLIDVLDEKCGLEGIKNAADVVWVGVELHKKWFDIYLERKAGEISSIKDIVQDLADVAERIVMEFSRKENIVLVENPLYWPANVLAANSMYRITRTILLYFDENGECQGEELFRKVICMIADILATCLTNLGHMIATKCRSNAIEERLESVRDAAIIFGESEDILKFFEKRKLSSVGPSQPLCIDEWRGWIEQQTTTISSSATSNGTSSAKSNEHVVVQMKQA